jgi:putative transposase
VDEFTLAIPKLSHGKLFPDGLEPRRRVEQALYAPVMEAYTGGISIRKVYALWRRWAGRVAPPSQR